MPLSPKIRVPASACETMVKTGVVIVAGEITTEAWVDFEEIVRDTVLEIGYNDSDMGFDGASCAVLNAVGKQSPNIAQGVDRGSDEEQGAGGPGPDVRLRDERNRRPHAGPDYIFAPSRAPPGRSSQERYPAVAAPGREEPGYVCL